MWEDSVHAFFQYFSNNKLSCSKHASSAYNILKIYVTIARNLTSSWKRPKNMKISIIILNKLLKKH